MGYSIINDVIGYSVETDIDDAKNALITCASYGRGFSVVNDDGLKLVFIKDLKKGDFFRLTINGGTLVRSNYNRSSKKYDVYYYEDVNRTRQLNGNKIVITDFIY